MKTTLSAAVFLAFFANFAHSDAPKAAKAPREALHPFGDLIGSWRGTGIPTGTRAQQEKGFWEENLAWEWKFKGQDAWIEVAIKDGKYFTSAELRYVADRDHFQLKLKTPAKETLLFTGQLNKEKVGQMEKDRILTVDREEKKEIHRLVISMLHPNRILYRYEIKPEGKSFFTKKYQVGCTKEGVPFAAGDGRPECIVSGGLGTMAVSYKGQTYYVCCSGCRSEFNENPEKYIKEFQEKKAKKK